MLFVMSHHHTVWVEGWLYMVAVAPPDGFQQLLSGTREQRGHRVGCGAEDGGYLGMALLLHLTQPQHLILHGGEAGQTAMEPLLVVGLLQVGIWRGCTVIGHGLPAVYRHGTAASPDIGTPLPGHLGHQRLGMLRSLHGLAERPKPQQRVLRYVFGLVGIHPSAGHGYGLAAQRRGLGYEERFGHRCRWLRLYYIRKKWGNINAFNIV